MTNKSINRDEKDILEISPTVDDEEMVDAIESLRNETTERVNLKTDFKTNHANKMKKKKMRLGNVLPTGIQKGIFIICLLAILLIPSIFIVQKYDVAQNRPILGVSEGDFYVWNEDSATRIDSSYKPTFDPNIIDNTITLDAACLEYESTQLVFRKLSLDSISGLNILLSPFFDENNNSIIPVTNQSIAKALLVREEFYDHLVDWDGSLLMDENRNYPILYTVFVPENTPAGDYYSNLKIESPLSSPFNITIKLHVYNFSLPVVHSYQSMVNPFTENYEFMDSYLSHRIDSSGIPINYTFDEENMQFSFTWDDWDNKTDYLIEQGQQSFAISTPMGTVRNFEKYSAEYNITLIRYYYAVSEHLREKAWINYSYIYVLDEPSYEECVEFESFCELVHSVDADLRILLTTAPEEKIDFLYDDIDIWAPIEHAVPEHWDEIQFVKSQGAEIVYYPCLFPKTPYANIQIYNPLIDSKVLAWQVFRWDLDGFLYWQTVAYYYNMHGYGYNSWFDGWLLYNYNSTTGESDSSMRWDALRDGFEDIEYFYMLKDLVASHSNYSEQADVIFDQIDNLLPDWTNFSQNPAEYYSIREDCAELIENILNEQ